MEKRGGGGGRKSEEMIRRGVGITRKDSTVVSESVSPVHPTQG